MAENELLPCPFCGGPATEEDPGPTWTTMVYCDNADCLSELTVHDRRGKTAAEIWNTRAPTKTEGERDDG